MSERPEFPNPSDLVYSWLSARLGSTFTRGNVSALNGDYPPAVHEFVSAWDAYDLAYDEWRKAQPIDRSDADDRLRFFGGPWLHWSDVRMFAHTGIPTEDDPAWLTSVDPYEAIKEAVERGVSEEKIRRFAGAVYEWISVSEQAKRDVGLAWKEMQE